MKYKDITTLPLKKGSGIIRRQPNLTLDGIKTAFSGVENKDENLPGKLSWREDASNVVP